MHFLSLHGLKKKLAQKIIYSPVNAVVVQRLVSIAEYTGTDPLVILAVLNPLHAEIVMAAELYGEIEKGMKVEIMSEGKLNNTYSGVVSIVDQIIDAASGTFGVQVEIQNKDLSIPAGLKCRVHYLSE